MFLIIQVVVYSIMKIIIILKSKRKSRAVLDSDFSYMKFVLLTNKAETFNKMEGRAQNKKAAYQISAEPSGWGQMYF